MRNEPLSTAKCGKHKSIKLIYFEHITILESCNQPGIDNKSSYFIPEMVSCLEIKIQGFLGGLSLHLNHLIASCVANYDWPFGTLPFGLFGSNLDTRDLETYPRTYSGHF